MNLSKQARAAFRAWGSEGGKKGDHNKKRASALMRWAKVKASKAATISPAMKVGE